ncbi:phage integrase central domain-containing protein [Pseudomonas sp. GL-RE-20]|uniref:phage integrase central domain-containing protein n=1 Tax=Pseudomonas sp. GL-RE-20 TaxID=2832372 RepID=UPI001CBD2B08|nr:hypothetical protein [Pseudomonas sp. GL-RE-20]
MPQLITFEKLATDYRDAHGSSWSEKWRKGWQRKLELYAFPIIGKLSADQIDTKHLIKALQPIWSSKTWTTDEVRGQSNKYSKPQDRVRSRLAGAVIWKTYSAAMRRRKLANASVIRP